MPFGFPPTGMLYCLGKVCLIINFNACVYEINATNNIACSDNTTYVLGKHCFGLLHHVLRNFSLGALLAPSPVNHLQ